MKPEKQSKSISWLQISDLHIVDGTQWNIMCGKYKKLAETFRPDFIVMTGDYRNIQYKENMDYNQSLQFLNLLIAGFGVSKEDVFIVPGNHDVNEYDGRQEAINEIIKKIKEDEDAYRKVTKENVLKGAFQEYENFIHRFYGDSITDIRVKDPAGVVSVKWKNQLNIILVNTALISDGSRNHEEILDIYELSKISVDSTLPTIVLGHHDIKSICSLQREYMVNIFSNLGVKAYLCGDAHQASIKPFKIDDMPNTTFPCIVCGKSAVDSLDNYSDVGFIWYEWKDNNVYVEPYEWRSKYNFVKSDAFLCNINQDYYFPMENKATYAYISVNGDDILIRPGNGSRSLILFSKKSLAAHNFQPKEKWSDEVCSKITSFAADGNGGFLAVEDGKIQLAYVKQDIFYIDGYLKHEKAKMEKGLGIPVVEVWIKDGICFFRKEDGSIVCSHKPATKCMELPPPRNLYIIIEDIKLSITHDEMGYKIEFRSKSKTKD